MGAFTTSSPHDKGEFSAGSGVAVLCGRAASRNFRAAQRRHNTFHAHAAGTFDEHRVAGVKDAVEHDVEIGDVAKD